MGLGCYIVFLVPVIYVNIFALGKNISGRSESHVPLTPRFVRSARSGLHKNSLLRLTSGKSLLQLESWNQKLWELNKQDGELKLGVFIPVVCQRVIWISNLFLITLFVSPSHRSSCYIILRNITVILTYESKQTIMRYFSNIFGFLC